jgi:hypothetical protein
VAGRIVRLTKPPHRRPRPDRHGPSLPGPPHPSRSADTTRAPRRRRRLASRRTRPTPLARVSVRFPRHGRDQRWSSRTSECRHRLHSSHLPNRRRRRLPRGRPIAQPRARATPPGAPPRRRRHDDAQVARPRA